MTPGKILILTPQLPFPLHQGTAIRNFGLVKGLAQRGHNIQLLSFAEEGQSPPGQTPLQELCAQIDTVPIPARTMTDRLADLVRGYADMARRLWSVTFLEKVISVLVEGQFDVVQVEGIEMAAYLPLVIGKLRESTPDVTVVYDAHNAEYALQARISRQDALNPARWHGAIYSFIQARRLRLLEEEICRLSDHVLAVSAADAGHLQRLEHSTPVTVIPNAIDVERYQTDEVIDLTHPALVFTGKMDYRPNVDAVLWFSDEILPLVREQEPDARFMVIGQKPHARLDRLRDRDDVTLTGWVESVQPYINTGDVYVAPLRMGSGTRLKLLQAMAMRKAIVSTRLGAEGISAKAGEHLLVADTPQAFADAVVSLLEDEVQRKALGQAAYQLVCARYDWQAVIPQVEGAYSWADSLK